MPDPPDNSNLGRPEPTPLPLPINLPKEIDGFQIQRVLGSGGMATVYAALQTQPRRIVALKVIKTGASSDVALRRFKREIEILGRLHHPHIAQVFAAGTYHDDGGRPVPFFVMEYISSATNILEHIAAKELLLRERLKLFVKVCAAVEHGHRNKIIHRDLKPGNILIDEYGEPKIIDFGIAHAAELDAAIQKLPSPDDNNEAGRVVGTLQYMSPEQLDKNAQDLDARCDVYALGVLLYRMLTGKPPHDVKGLPIGQAVRMIREQQPVPAGAINPEIRGDLEKIILKAMNREKAHRYSSAGSLGRDVIRYLSNKPIRARRAGLFYRAMLLAKRHRTALTVTSIIALIMGAAIAIVSIDRSRNRTAQLANDAALRRDQDALRQEREIDLARIAAGHNGDAHAGMSATNAAELFSLNGHTARIGKLAFIPGENQLISTSYDHSLIIWDLDRRAARVTMNAINGAVVHLAATMDGSFIAAAADTEPILIIDSKKAALAQTIAAPNRRLQTLALSPNGARLALATDDLTMRLIATGVGEEDFSAPSAKSILFRSTTGAFSCIAFDRDGTRIAAGSRGGGVYVWELPSGRLAFRLNDLPGETAAISLVDNRLVALSAQGQAAIWHMSDEAANASSRIALPPSASTFNVLSGGRGSHRADSAAGELMAGEFNTTGNLLVVALRKEIVVWDLIGSTLQPEAAYRGGPVMVGSPLPIDETPCAVALDADGRWWAVGHLDGAITIMRIPTR